MIDVSGLGLFAIVSLPGLGLLWTGYNWHRVQSQIRDLEEADISDATSGLVKVTGEAQPTADVGTVTAPVSGTDCLAYEFEIQGHNSTQDHPDWSDFEERSDRRRLQVEDATGTAVVDPEEFDMLFEEHVVAVAEEGEDAPPEVEAFLDDYEHGDTVFGRWPKIRFVERRLEPGEKAFVVGYASDTVPSTPIAGATTHISKGDNARWKKLLGKPLVFSDKDESTVLKQQTGWAKAAILFGCFWMVLSLYLGMIAILG